MSKRVPETLPKNSGRGHNSYDIVGNIAIIRPAGPGSATRILEGPSWRFIKT